MSRLATALARHAAERPGTIAISGGKLSITYGELPRIVRDLAESLQPLLPANGAIAAALDNGPAIVLLDLALARLGRIFVPLPLFFTEAQRRSALSRSGASCLIIAVASHRESRLEIGGQSVDVLSFPFSVTPVPQGTAKITFTSGSTGTPKGVCLSQAMMEETAAAIVAAIGGENGARHCALMPFAVLLENVAGLYAVLIAGGTYVALPLAEVGLAKPFAPDFVQMIGTLAATRATSAIIVPELLRGLVAVLAMRKMSLPALAFLAVGGAAVSPELLKQAAALGLPVFEGYGLSEAGSVVSLNSHGANRVCTAGRYLPHVKAHIAADGELMISHPVFLGFAGQAAFSGALATGDIVSRDDDGYVSIRGRKTSLIITGFGRNLSPEWVERELLVHPVIRQALVFGDGAAALSALIVPASADVTRRQIQTAVDAANASLPEYAAVKCWSLADPFTPANGQLTSNGRLRRAAIHQAYSAQMQFQATYG